MGISYVVLYMYLLHIYTHSSQKLVPVPVDKTYACNRGLIAVNTNDSTLAMECGDPSTPRADASDVPQSPQNAKKCRTECRKRSTGGNHNSFHLTIANIPCEEGIAAQHNIELNERIAKITRSHQFWCDREELDELNGNNLFAVVSSLVDNLLLLHSVGECEVSTNNGESGCSDDESVDSLMVTRRRIERRAQRNINAEVMSGPMG